MDWEEILTFWFRELTPPQWFRDGRKLDDTIRERFGDLLEKAKRDELDAWTDSPSGRLALIILLDQFSRHIFRDTPEAYAGDKKAQQLTQEGIDIGMDQELETPVKRHFFYMPLMHAEDKELQALGIVKFTANSKEFPGGLGAAKGHAAMVEQFGRFPHRNKILGRTSTPEELEFISNNPRF